MNKDMPAWKELLAGVTVVDATALTARLGCWAEQISEGLMAGRGRGGTTNVVPAPFIEISWSSLASTTAWDSVLPPSNA